jgi:hypothetical protein
MMLEEVRTGKAQSFLLIQQVDAIRKKNLEPRTVEPGNLEAENRLQPRELGHCRWRVATLEDDCRRFSREQRNLARASCEKYGSCIGEVLVGRRGGKWLKVQLRETVMNAVAIGIIYVMPALIVQTVLEGKKLNMGEQAAESVVQFVAFTLEPFAVF